MPPKKTWPDRARFSRRKPNLSYPVLNETVLSGRKPRSKRVQPRPPPQVPFEEVIRNIREDTLVLDEIVALSPDWDRDDRQRPVSEEPPQVPECPSCHMVVDQQLLEDFLRRHENRDPAMRSTDFCSLHKEAEDITAWQQHELPQISWQSLITRTQAYEPYLRLLFDRKVISGYDENFTNALEARGVVRAIPPLGYFGLTGLELLQDHFTDTFYASNDPVIHRSPAHFISQVLIPETLLLLIQDDMSVPRARAAEILHDRDIQRLGMRMHAGEGVDVYVTPARYYRGGERMK